MGHFISSYHIYIYITNIYIYPFIISHIVWVLIFHHTHIYIHTHIVCKCIDTNKSTNWCFLFLCDACKTFTNGKVHSIGLQGGINDIGRQVHPQWSGFMGKKTQGLREKREGNEWLYMKQELEASQKEAEKWFQNPQFRDLPLCDICSWVIFFVLMFSSFSTEWPPTKQLSQFSHPNKKCLVSFQPTNILSWDSVLVALAWAQQRKAPSYS